MPTNPFEYLWPGIVAAQAIYVDEKMQHRGHGDHSAAEPQPKRARKICASRKHFSS
jgi:hypothetical protein